MNLSDSSLGLPKKYRYPGLISEKLLGLIFQKSGINGELIVQFSHDSQSFGNGLPSAKIWPPTFFRLMHLLSRADYNIGDFYKKGYWYCSSENLYDVLKILSASDRSMFALIFRFFRGANFFRDILLYSLFPHRVRSNISLHYDTDPEFMRLILGSGLIYTCAFFENDGSTLEEAQRRKIDLVGKRLDLRPNEMVLDLGCGWGAAASILSQEYGCHITGISIAKGQIEYARINSSSNTKFIHSDYVYFAPNQQFDKVYSIGMLEHIGKYKHHQFFSKIREILKNDGVALVHSIVRDRPGITNSWIDKEIFPGAYIPSLSEILASVEKSGLVVVNIFAHSSENYFKTLREWHNRFIENKNSLRQIMKRDLSDEEAEEVIRTWEFYLCGSRLPFDKEREVCKNFQIILRKR